MFNLALIDAGKTGFKTRNGMSVDHANAVQLTQCTFVFFFFFFFFFVFCAIIISRFVKLLFSCKYDYTISLGKVVFHESGLCSVLPHLFYLCISCARLSCISELIDALGVLIISFCVNYVQCVALTMSVMGDRHISSLMNFHNISQIVCKPRQGNSIRKHQKIRIACASHGLTRAFAVCLRKG